MWWKIKQWSTVASWKIQQVVFKRNKRGSLYESEFLVVSSLLFIFFLLFLYLRGMSNNWKCHTVRLTLTSVQVQLSTRSICVEYIKNSTPSHRSGMTWLNMVYTVKCNMSNDAVIVPHVCNVLCYFVCFCFLDNVIRKFH